MLVLQGWLLGALRKICPIIRDLYNGMNIALYQTRASQLDTRLHLVRISLESLLPDWNSPGVEQQCEKVFTDLAEICTGKPMKDKMEAWPELCKSFEANNDHSLRRAWRRLLNQEASTRTVQNLIEECERLVYKFFPFTIDNVNTLPAVPELLAGDQQSISLITAYNMSRDFVLTHVKAMLERNAEVTFLDLLVSSKDLRYWLEVRLRVQRIDQKIEGLKGFAPGQLCKLLGNNLYACLFLSFHNGADSGPDPSSEPELYVLEEEKDISSAYKPGRGLRMSEVLLSRYDFSTKDKILLAHIIARAYWQLYGSELTRNLWTSNSICFMEQENLGVTDNQNLPLTSCLTFDFDASCDSQPAHQQSEHTPIHEFPGVLSIGIILLEIALCQPFPPSEYKGAQGINRRHQIAKARLEELKMRKWDCFPSKWIFDAAVEECLTFKIQRGKRKLDIRSREEKARDEFYTKVVCRLAYLLKFGFNSSSAGRVCPKKQDEGKAVLLDEPGGEFQTGRPLIASKWLENLKRICKDVEKQREMHNVADPIKVAILDTGCDLSLLPGGADGHTVEWEDFTEESSQRAQDTHGHGTLMARLVLECAPCAKIIVARIAKDVNSLGSSQDRIYKALHWAGIDRKANIISMSFGFPKTNGAISMAIDTIKRNRPVIFLASAGNSSNKNESFPARHQSVISIYAANYMGVFSDSNASIEIGGKIALGTFGDHIPDDIRDAFEARQDFQGVCRPGSSVATAVASGISAIMLAYTVLLPKVVQPSVLHSRRLRWMWETEGMEAVMKAMARPEDGQIQKRFVDPATFWMSRKTDVDRLSRIMDHLVDVDNEGELRTESE